MRDDSLVEFVLDQLSDLPGVEARRMFGGHGLYLDGEFFGMVWKGRAFFRTDDRSRQEYRVLGSDPIPFGDDPSENTYWSVPVDVLEDSPRLVAWARAAAATPRPAGRRRKRKARAPRRAAGGRALRRGSRGGRRSTPG